MFCADITVAIYYGRWLTSLMMQSEIIMHSVFESIKKDTVQPLYNGFFMYSYYELLVVDIIYREKCKVGVRWHRDDYFPI